MPDEKGMWDALRPYMERAGMDPVRVENPALPGTPDVNYIEGWIELKHADRWPPRGGPLRLKHPPTPQQRTFLVKRHRKGGTCTLLLRVGKEWFVIAPMDVLEMWGGGLHPSEAVIRERALFSSHGPRPIAEFYLEYKNKTL